MKKILIATGNQGKLKELIEGFSLYGMDKYVEFLSLNDFPQVDFEPEENGKNYEENALIKAQYFAKKFNIPTIGEDSGLELKAFPGKFGIKTKREISAKNDTEWLEKFLKMMDKIDDRRASFFSATAFFDSENEESATFLGTTSGEITQAPETTLEKGIPVSAVFKVNGEQEVFSQMNKDEKNKISHRGKSVKKMSEFLKKKYQQNIKKLNNV